MKKCVFIVEGWSDHDQLRKAFSDINTIVLRGPRFDADIMADVGYHMRDGYTVFILTDPDSTGDMIACKILRHYDRLGYPICRIPVDPDRACCMYNTRMKFGVEYCKLDYLRELLTPYINGTQPKPELIRRDLRL